MLWLLINGILRFSTDGRKSRNDPTLEIRTAISRFREISNRSERNLGMSTSASIAYNANRLLRSLPTEEFERIQRNSQTVLLPRGRVIWEAGDAAHQVYFPLSGVISLLSTTEAGEVIEVAMVGNEGTTALPVIMHAREMPYRAQIQVPVD